MARRSLLIPVLMMLVAMPTLIGLGVWQWQRLHEKEALIARIEARTTAAPRVFDGKALQAAGGRVDEIDYTPVTLEGRFLNETEAFVFTNRPDATRDSVGGPGYDVLSVFALKGGGSVLVDRGFVPDVRRDAATRPEGQIEHDIVLSGIVRRPERRTYLDADDAPQKNYFAIRDPKAILAAKLDANRRAALEPVIDTLYLDLRAPAPPGGLPDPNRTELNIPNNHLQYAFTWWGLALVFAAMFALFLRSRSVQD
ncbi:MAG: SURF1 family protein [Beijerinckiaceae bacterium]|nr:SURF1 family protein [Beijerinckiaceae bacterium]